MLRFDRKQQNSVKQLSFNYRSIKYKKYNEYKGEVHKKKKKKDKEKTGREVQAE